MGAAAHVCNEIRPNLYPCVQTALKKIVYLKSEGIRCECTVPETPEQNGVAERLNRTLIEKVSSMLIDVT